MSRRRSSLGPVLVLLLHLPHVLAQNNMWVNPAYVMQYAGSSLALQAQDQIVRQTPTWANQGPWAVTNSQVLPPSGNAHDYLSWAPYWWANCNWCTTVKRRADMECELCARAAPANSTTKKTTSTSTKKATSTSTKKTTSTSTKKPTSTSTRRSTSTTSSRRTTSTSTRRSTTTPRPTSTARSTTLARSTTRPTTAARTGSQTTSPAGCTPSPTTSLAPSATWSVCPYVLRDGVTNPEARTILQDTVWMSTMSEAIHLSALSGAFGRNTKGFADAARFIRMWFLDSATYVNPSLNYGQMVRGKGNYDKGGSYTGILDWRFLTKVCNAVAIMRMAKASDWAQTDDANFVSWAKKYITWLTTNKLGQQAAVATNNHGSFYYNQLAALQIIVGDNAGAVKSLNTYFTGIYRGQINSNGEQPLEAARTLPGQYQAFNAEAMIVNARLGDYLGQNYWTMKTSQNATIQTAVNYLMPLAQNPSSSTPNPIYNTIVLAPHVAAVQAAYGDPDGRYQNWLVAANFSSIRGTSFRTQMWYFFDQVQALPYSPNGRKFTQSASSSITGVATTSTQSSSRSTSTQSSSRSTSTQSSSASASTQFSSEPASTTIID